MNQGSEISPIVWTRWPEALRMVSYRPHLRKSVSVALIVGTILFCINHLDTVLRGEATTATWVKGALTYLVPFCVTNVGILIASRRKA